jgi:hypothetical protein
LRAGIYQSLKKRRLRNLTKLETRVANIYGVSVDYSDRQEYVDVIVGTRYYRHEKRTPNLLAHP